jgi:hypothetical protein
MKKWLLLFFAAFLLQPGISQNNVLLERKVDSLERIVGENNYTRIPKKDFEEILTNRVSDTVYNTIYKWIAFLGAIIGLVGVGVAAYAKTQIRERVEEETEKKTKELENKLAKLEASQREENTRQDNKIDEQGKKIEGISAAQSTFIENTQSAVDNKINDSLGFIWDDIADSYLEKAKNKNYKDPVLTVDIHRLLNNKKITIHDSRKVLLIDTLMKCYHYSKTEDRYTNMINLIRQYENNLRLMPETYANAAIAFCDRYEYHGLDDYSASSIENCDKSILQLPSYGDPYGIKLEVYIMNFVKGRNDEEKEKALQNVRELFVQIHNHRDDDLSKNILNRFALDQQLDYLKPYVEELEKRFPDDFKKLRERAKLPEPGEQDKNTPPPRH